MKKFDDYFNSMIVFSLGGASIGSFINKENGLWWGAGIGAIFGFVIIFMAKKRKRKRS